MTDEQEYEEYRNTLNEIVDGGGCVETMTAASDMRRSSSPSRRDLLTSDAVTAGIADSVDDVLAEVDTEAAKARLRADYDDLDDVRTALRATVGPALFDALPVVGFDAFALEPAVCLKTFREADLEDALTLVPQVHEDGVVGRIVARTTTEGATVTLHAIPEWGRSYAVLSTDDGEQLVLPDGTTRDCTDAPETKTGLDCDPERAARTMYVQTTVTVDGTDYVVETTCSTV